MTSTIPETEAYALGAPAGRLVEAGDGDALWIAELGEGKPTVFLHGGGPGCTSWTDFAPTVPFFTDDRKVILVDMANYGFSTQTVVEGPRWTFHAAKIAAALKNIGISDADFVCNSVGRIGRDRPRARLPRTRTQTRRHGQRAHRQGPRRQDPGAGPGRLDGVEQLLQR